MTNFLCFIKLTTDSQTKPDHTPIEMGDRSESTSKLKNSREILAISNNRLVFFMEFLSFGYSSSSSSKKMSSIAILKNFPIFKEMMVYREISKALAISCFVKHTLHF